MAEENKFKFTQTGAQLQAAINSISGKADASLIGNLSDLHTTNKTNLVAAINEAAQSGGASMCNVTFSLTTDEGSADFTGKKIIITINGEETEVTLNATGGGTTSIATGLQYSVTFPDVNGFITPTSQNKTSEAGSVTVSAQYVLITKEKHATSIILEESSNPAWTRGGNLEAINDILDKFGSYVLDPVNKKFAKLHAENHSKFADGTDWSGSFGEAFRRLPRVYYKVETSEDGKSKLWVSLLPISDKYWEETFIGTYKGNVSGGALHSRPGVAATGSMTMSAFWNAAQATGTEFGLVNYFDHCMLNALHLAKFGNANSETTMGKGLQDGGSSYYSATTGKTASLGDGTGQAAYNDTQNQNKLFGIEALAGQMWEFRPNIRFSGTNGIIYKGNQVSNTIAEGDADFVRKITRNESLSGVYITHMLLGENFDMIPITAGGSASTYWCDAAWAATGGQLLLVGGNSYNGSYCGLSSASSGYAFSLSAAHIGARLSFVGNIGEWSLVSGSALAALNS